MAGIYIHIPFCKQACHYCNFHFSTSLKYKEELLAAIHKEIAIQKGFLDNAPIETIYLGGGTPSLLNQNELNALFEQIHHFHQVASNAEITIEANPDDLTTAYLNELQQTPINRLSIGIQSFSDKDLKFMNRAHNASEAQNCIQKAQAAGFENLTVDLIYGSPTTSQAQWEQNLEQVISLNVPHLSSYCLTVEPQTALAHLVKVGKAKPVDDAHAAQQFEYLQKTTEAAGFIHYEISNFAQPDCYARHNSNYWKGVPYLGLGPSAHSFNGENRQANVAHNVHYIKALTNNELDVQVEVLTPAQRYNEYVLTGLRTIWGCDLARLQAFGSDFEQHFLKNSAIFLRENKMQVQKQTYSLTKTGKLFADHIAMELFWEE